MKTNVKYINVTKVPISVFNFQLIKKFSGNS